MVRVLGSGSAVESGRVKGRDSLDVVIMSKIYVQVLLVTWKKENHGLDLLLVN